MPVELLGKLAAVEADVPMIVEFESDLNAPKEAEEMLFEKLGTGISSTNPLEIIVSFDSTIAVGFLVSID